MMTENTATRRAAIQALESAGRGMANLCFNLSQQESIPASARMSMKKAQGEWDAALRVFVSLEGTEAPPPSSHLTPEYERQEAVCTDAAMSQWERSLKRPDMQERDRVRGAVEAYKRQALAFRMLPPAPQEHAAVDCRALAVEIVDGIRGYTFEFSAHPSAHKEDYDFIGEKLRAVLATTEGQP